MPRSQAVLFDLDDTLYPLSRFVRSGFRAVAAHLERTHGIERSRVFRALAAARYRVRGLELQAVAEEFSLPGTVVPELVTIIRRHQPAIRLPRQSARALALLRPDWGLGVVTNGLPEIQARKVDALGLRTIVDTIVFASEHGTGLGKPDPAPFLAALAHLNVRPDRAVFVGNDERCDLFGASSVGMRTIFYVSRHSSSSEPVRFSQYADVVVDTLVNVPALAAALLGGNGKGVHHVS